MVKICTDLRMREVEEYRTRLQRLEKNNLNRASNEEFTRDSTEEQDGQKLLGKNQGSWNTLRPQEQFQKKPTEPELHFQEDVSGLLPE